MSPLTKLLRGGESHRSRLHDEKGRLIDAAGLAYLPHSLASTFGRVVLGRRPAVPWIGYRARAALAAVMPADGWTLEFGAGMSTVWYAARSARVVSVECDSAWHGQVVQMLAQRRLDHAECRLVPEITPEALADLPDGAFSLAIVDGAQRDVSMEIALRKVRSGGHVFLDNSDKKGGGVAGDVPRAERLLLDAAARAGTSPRYFTDLVPTYVMVTEGLLVQV